MEPIALRYFREVATHGSVRHAAERLFLAQSAVSRQIAMLENELGVPLFERHARGMTLTEAGHLILAYSTDMRCRLEELRGHFQQYETLHRGHVEIVCVEGILVRFMPNALRIFADECPGISLNVAALGSHAVAEAIAEHRFDLGIVFGSSPRIDLLELATMNQPLCAVVSSGHPLAKLGRCNLAEVADFHVVLPDRSFGIRQLIDRVSANGKFKLNKMIETNTIAFAQRLVMQSKSHVTFLPGDMVLPEIEAGTLVAVPLIDSSLRGTRVTLVASTTRKLSKAASHMARHLTELMKSNNSDVNARPRSRSNVCSSQP
jgi:DNA-binding transcriptional LysR family regulator